MKGKNHGMRGQTGRRRCDTAQTVFPRAVQQAYQRLLRWIIAPGVPLRCGSRRQLVRI